MQCAKSERIAVRTLYYWNNIQEVLTELASSNTVIGTRFHAVILGLLAGAEVLPIMYSNKTGYVLDDLGFDMAHALILNLRIGCIMAISYQILLRGMSPHL